MFSGLGKGKRRQNGDMPSLGPSTSTAPNWLGKSTAASANVQKKPGKQQLKLVYPGEVGSGIATLRQKKAHPDSSFSASTATSSSSKASTSKRKAAPATLDSFFSKSAPARRKSRSKSVTTNGNSKRQKPDSKGKQRVIEEAEEDSEATEPEVEDLDRLASLEPDLRSERSDKPNALSPAPLHQPKANTQQTSLKAEIILPPMPKPLPAPKPPNLGLFGFGALPRPPSPSPPKAKKQKLVIESSSPIKASAQNEKILAPPSTPSFFATAPSQTSSSPLSPVRQSPQKQSVHQQSGDRAVITDVEKQDRKRRRGSRIAWDSQDSVELRRLNRSPSSIAVQESLVAKRPPRCAPSVHLSQDVTDYMDAFRDEEYSEDLQYTLEPSMQRVRLERLGLSPVDVRKLRAEKDKLWKEEMQGIRERKRRQEEERMALVEERMASEAAALAKGRAKIPAKEDHMELDSDFDESATEKTLPSQASLVLCRRAKHPQPIDDSGFEDAIIPVPLSEETSQKSIYTLAPNSQPASDSLTGEPETIPSSQQDEGHDLVQESMLEESVVRLPPATAARLRSGFAAILPKNLLEYPETLPQEEDALVETVPDSEDEEIMSLDMLRDQGEGEDTQEAVASLLIQPASSKARPHFSRILAIDTQDTAYFDTQDINVEETMLDVPLLKKPLGSVRDEQEDNETYEISVPNSQGNGEEEEELDLHARDDADDVGVQQETRGNQPSPFTDAISTANLIITRKGQKPKSVEDSIRLAGFGNVLESSLQGQRLAQQRPAQTDLLQFFPVKEGGPAEKQAQATRECQKAFSKAVGELSRSYARKEVVDEKQEESLLDEETIPDSQVVPSSQTQEDVLEAESIHDDFTLPPDLGPETDMHMALDYVEDSEDEDEGEFDVKAVSCEAWVEGLTSQVPSPVKRLRGV